jgi:hypothetical protein
MIRPGGLLLIVPHLFAFSVIGGVAKKKSKSLNLNVNFSFSGSHIKHHWRCSKEALVCSFKFSGAKIPALAGYE